ncbi:MAG: helix-turn-helix domain-containing protein [Candidatus Latescibacterota bacterium]
MDGACTKEFHAGMDEHLRTWVEALPSNMSLRGTLESLERLLIQRALRRSGGIQAEAARNLGISRSDMVYKMRKYHLVTG